MKVINKTQKSLLRTMREKECFPIINRGKIWYDSLTSDQYAELKRWYEAWLDVTETGFVPAKPKWLYNEKVNTEEVIY